MVSQREYEMIQKIGEHDPEVIFKALLDAKSAKVRLSAVLAISQSWLLHILHCWSPYNTHQ